MLLETDHSKEDKIDLILYKVKELQKEIAEIKASVEAHRTEHGFAKMETGGVNANFGGMNQSGPPTMPMPGMGGGYQQPGMGAPMSDPSRPPGM